jgi:hypothetical protein
MNYEEYSQYTLAMAHLTADTIRQIVLIADANDKDRDSALERFAEVFDKIAANYSLEEYDPDGPVAHVGAKN